MAVGLVYLETTWPRGTRRQAGGSRQARIGDSGQGAGTSVYPVGHGKFHHHQGHFTLAKG